MRCDQFFKIYPMDDEQKLISVGLHLDGEAGSWYLAYYKSHPRLTWLQFVEGIEVRFCNSMYSNILGEFNRCNK